MTIADFCAQQGKDVKQVQVMAFSGTPQQVQAVGAIIGNQVAYTSDATVYAVLLDFGLQDQELPG